MWERATFPTRQRLGNRAARHDDTCDGGAYDTLSMDGRRGRLWRLLGLGWLLVLINPVTELFRTHQSPLRIAFGLVGVATFVALYLWMLFSDRERQTPYFTRWLVIFLILIIETFALNLVFGVSWVGLFFFLSVSAGRAPPRTAVWLIVSISIGAGLVDAASGLSITDTSLLSIQIGLIGISMIGVFQMVRVNREMRAAREENARLAVAEAVAKERLRFARELHDSVTQELFSMTLHARTTLKNLDRTGTPADDPTRQQVKILSDLAQAALAEMRMLIFELRPGALAEEGLVNAVRKLAAAVSAREEIAIDVDAPIDRLILGTQAEEHLYRLVQEALNNVVKHAGARRAIVRITLAEGAKLVVEIRDDGKGFDPALAHPGHMGLETMTARTREMGGDHAIITAPGTGTTVRVTVPLDPRPHDPRHVASEARPLLSR